MTLEMPLDADSCCAYLGGGGGGLGWGGVGVEGHHNIY